MPEVIVDSAMVARLSNLSGTTAVRDESGHILGFFVPAAEAGSLWPAVDGCPYSAEELDRLRKEKGGKRLAEIWRTLGQQ